MTLIKYIYIFLFIGLFGCQEEQKQEVKAPQKPNIIFVLADDLGYGDLGCYGQKMIKTPNLDQMASEGLKFTNCYAGNSVCFPSRSTIMTGHHPGHSRHRANYGMYRGEMARVPFERGTKTIASRMQELGYHTGHVGKWHLGGWYADSTSANFLGFDYSYSHYFNYFWTAAIKQKMKGVYEPYYFDSIWINNELQIIEGNRNHGKKVYCEELYTNAALDYIRKQKDEPFFLYLAYTAPHAPQVPYSEEPYHNENWPEVERKFAAEMNYLDENMGKLFQLLKDLKIDDNTIVFFSSDNGAHHEMGHDHEFFNSNGNLKGYKRDMYEGGLRVPMIVRWPGKIKPNQTTDHVCAFWDMLPTCTELGGKLYNENIDGISMVPTLLGNEEKQEEHEYLYWELMESGGRQGMRMGNWKGVRYDIDNKGLDAPIELYDLSQDEEEQNNLAENHPEIVKKIDQKMQEARDPSPFFQFKGE